MQEDLEAVGEEETVGLRYTLLPSEVYCVLILLLQVKDVEEVEAEEEMVKEADEAMVKEAEEEMDAEEIQVEEVDKELLVEEINTCEWKANELSIRKFALLDKFALFQL